MGIFFHSVTLDESKCVGCTNCIKRCPTEAIRVRSGKAVIMSERCIDCGECIRICPHHAKRAKHDHLSMLEKFIKSRCPHRLFMGSLIIWTIRIMFYPALKSLGSMTSWRSPARQSLSARLPAA